MNVASAAPFCYAELRPRTDSKNQQRSKHDVEKHTKHLETHGRFYDAGSAQRCTERDKGKLE